MRASLTKHLLFACTAAAVAGLTSSAGADVAGLEFTKIFETGEGAPGSGGMVFNGFQAPVINDAGQIAFYGVYGQPDGTDLVTGIWASAGDTFNLAAAVGGIAPGTGDDFPYTGFAGQRVGLSDSGDIVFAASIASGDAGADRGIWSGPVNALDLVAIEGQNAPGVNLPFNNNLGVPVIGPSGIVAFDSAVEGDNGNGLNEPSYFLGTAGNLSALAIAGDDVVGEAGNTLYQGISTTLRVNSSGVAAFAARLKGTSEPANPDAIFVGPAGGAAVLAAVGRTAPGAGDGITFGAVRHPDLNDEGQVAFVAGLDGIDGLDPTVGAAIYLGTSSADLAPIALHGEEAVATPGLLYDTFATNVGPSINSEGEVAFMAWLSGGDFDSEDRDSVIIAGDPDNLRIVAREEVNLPVDFQLMSAPAIGDGGHVAFQTFDPNSGDFELWIANLENTLFRVVGTGDDFEVAPGDIREVSTLIMGTGQDGYAFLNEDGMLAFTLGFADGSQGIFTSRLVAIPAPAAAGALAGPLGLVLRRRRK